MDKTTKLMIALEQWVDAIATDVIEMRTRGDCDDSCIGMSAMGKRDDVEKALRELLDGRWRHRSGAPL